LLLIFCSSYQRTALLDAAFNGCLAVCKLLIAAKADVDAKDWCAYFILNLLLILVCILVFSFASNFLF
jgi:hypothetical protein